MFGGILCLAGFAGTLVGGRLNERLAAHTAAFDLSGYALIASLPFTALAILSPQPAIFWPAIGVTLFLIFLSLGPLNAAIANVLPANLRSQGFAINVLAIHFLGDAISPYFIGLASDHLGGLKWPVFGAGSLLVLAGLVLLAGRRALDHDLARARATHVSADYQRELETARAIAIEAADLVKTLRGGGSWSSTARRATSRSPTPTTRPTR